MNRLGFRPDAFRAAWARLNALPQVDEISLMTHFANADAMPDARAGADSRLGIAAQMAVFRAATQDLPGECSLSNSAATLRHATDAAVRADWVRAGILSYGSAPDFPAHGIDHWDLVPTMTLRSKLIATQDLHAGDAVGYGSTYVAHGPLRIGIVACGYADGYPRHAGTGTPVLVEGRRCSTVGRVSMDMLAVDLTPVPAAAVGSEVTLWGHGPPRDGRPTVLPIDEVALAAGTIGYELMCALARRVPVRTAE
jgi:alanine racemase